MSEGQPIENPGWELTKWLCFAYTTLVGLSALSGAILGITFGYDDFFCYWTDALLPYVDCVENVRGNAVWEIWFNLWVYALIGTWFAAAVNPFGLVLLLLAWAPLFVVVICFIRYLGNRP